MTRDGDAPAGVQYGMRIVHVGSVGLVLALLLVAPFALAEEEPAPGGGRGGGPRGGGSMWDRLKALDTDEDGKISREEAPGRERMFERLDADGDGFITEAEAMRSRRGGRQGGGRGAAGANAPSGVTLEMIDANQDGVISLGEWTELFATADCDGDGRVSAEEWKQLLAPVSRPGGKAPAVGSKAPAVQAVPLAGGEPVDLAAPKRTTVLVFGSWT